MFQRYDQPVDQRTFLQRVYDRLTGCSLTVCCRGNGCDEEEVNGKDPFCEHLETLPKTRHQGGFCRHCRRFMCHRCMYSFINKEYYTGLTIRNGHDTIEGYCSYCVHRYKQLSV